MPINPTYPGVYVEEISSGVRTITGVSTSVTAFLGKARRGPINKAVRVLSYADFERRYGGLYSPSYMSYAVRQFFLNGGTDAWIVRLVKSSSPARLTLVDANAADALELTARDEGKAGNNIQVSVDYATSNPASTFNLVLSYSSPDTPGDAQQERFENLSMNSQDARYAVSALESSRLVCGNRLANLGALTAGTSTSGELADVRTLLDDNHTRFQVSINGLPAVEVVLKPNVDNAGANAAAALSKLCTAIRDAIKSAAAGEAALDQVNCVPDGNKIKITSGVTGENSTVRVLSGVTLDAATRLKLGTASGGVEADAVAAIRPRPVPDPGTLTSDVHAALLNLPSNARHVFKISLDGSTATPIDLGTTAAGGAALADNLANLAVLIQQKVRAARPANAAFAGFTASVKDNDKLLLSSGTRGQGSSVVVSAGEANDIAGDLKLLAGATGQPGKDVFLTGGDEQDYAPAEEGLVFNGSRAGRTGLYALEAVDIFNILCLPGVTDTDVLNTAAAYCTERRAFLIVDAPFATINDPAEMSTVIASTSLPKTNFAAVYYPWLKIADPLKNGKLADFPPSGTIAGLFARTDSSRGVWKAPAGTEAVLVGVQGMSYQLSDPENGVLNPLGVNCLRVLPLFGPLSWGARTLRGANEMADEYKYIPVRRTALFIEETLYRSLKWVVFEPNDEPLWAQIRLNVGAFLHGLFRQGAFQGRTPRDAYFVKCDSETTTQNDINQGVVNILVGFAPLKPAEFVMVKIQQIAGQLEAA
jgi:uncharacterized protein